MSWNINNGVDGFCSISWVGQGKPKQTKKTMFAPCEYCMNEVQLENALNCHGCGAPLKLKMSMLDETIYDMTTFKDYIDYREDR